MITSDSLKESQDIDNPERMIKKRKRNINWDAEEKDGILFGSYFKKFFLSATLTTPRPCSSTISCPVAVYFKCQVQYQRRSNEKKSRMEKDYQNVETETLWLKKANNSMSSDNSRSSSKYEGLKSLVVSLIPPDIMLCDETAGNPAQHFTNHDALHNDKSLENGYDEHFRNEEYHLKLQLLNTSIKLKEETLTMSIKEHKQKMLLMELEKEKLLLEIAKLKENDKGDFKIKLN